MEKANRKFQTLSCLPSNKITEHLPSVSRRSLKAHVLLDISFYPHHSSCVMLIIRDITKKRLLTTYAHSEKSDQILHQSVLIKICKGWPWKQEHINVEILGPVVQSVISLTSSLWVISLTVFKLADSIYNILIFFAKKM